jgi:HSP20 family protein
MANITRRDTNQSPARATSNVWDTMRLVDSMLNWDPFSALMPTAGTAASQTFMPHFDVKETKDSYVFTADLPGIKEEDLEIQFTGNQLVISGKRDATEQKDSDRYHLYERVYGRFTRSFTLPDGTNADQVTAHLKDGVLNLTIGKRPEVQPRKIPLSAKPQGSA